jgi:tetratricopeptide (TPR) repeat protein
VPGDEPAELLLPQEHRQELVRHRPRSYLLGKYKSSLEVAKDAYKLNPADPEIFYILGKIALALGDKPTALTNFRSSVSKEPNEAAYIEQARIYMGDLEFIQAADLLKEALK